MHTSSVKVTKGRHVFGGWNGTLTIDGDDLKVTGAGAESLAFDVKHVRRASFNSNNGLWAFRLHDGSKVFMQSAGGLLSADRTPAGHEANTMIRELLRRHGIKSFRV